MKEFRVLDRVEDFRDLKDLSEEELKLLAQDIREYIIDVTSKMVDI